jgi:hypothetical protein
VGPEVIVEPPLTVPPLHSLLASAPELQFLNPTVQVSITEDGDNAVLDDRWEAGLVFQPYDCINPQSWAPCARTNEIQCFPVDATSGTWTIDFLGGGPSAPLAFDIAAGDLQFALGELPSVGHGNVIVTGGPGDDGGTEPYCVEFTGAFAESDVPDLVVADVDLAGGGATVGPITVAQEAGELVLKSDPVGQDAVFYEPLVLEVPYRCSTFSRLEWEDYRQRALYNLMLGKSKALEAEFWSGAKIPTNPSLVRSTPNDDDHILNPGGAAAPTAVSPGVALVLIAQALSNCGAGGRGMIHATPALAERWSNLTAINWMPKDSTCLALPEEMQDRIAGDCVLATPARGDIVINGAGYPGTGPLGQPPPGPNQVWAYATSMVNVIVGEEQVYPDSLSEALDRATNTVEARAECSAAAVYDLCCSFAVLVDICGSV